MVAKVIKRDGSKVDFDKSKIIQAIGNVFKEFGIKNIELAENLTEKVLKRIEDGSQPHVEQIQDIVEDVLIAEGYVKEAKAYIRYRAEREKARKEWIKDELPLSLWTRKYQFEGENFEIFLNRVSPNQAVRKLIKEKKFNFAGRILANRKLNEYGIKVTYSNCYVTTPPEDNIESILDSAKRLARTFSYGGGSGIDISKLRPRNARVNNAAKTTSGAVSFLDIFDVVSEKIGQKGRRAALMVSIDVSHPDVEEFIDKKLDLDAVEKANMSVRVTDDFLKAAENHEDFWLDFVVEDTGEVINKKVKADKILNKLAYGSWYSGEPAMLYWDRIKNYTILSEYDDFEFAGTNPCAEEPLPEGGSCLLGSLNLANFVENPFTDDAKFNFLEFEDAVETGVVSLNQVLEEGLDLHPLEEQRESVQKWRQIGLGIMGLGSMLIKMGIEYGSEEALELSEKIGKTMANEALKTSAHLAAIWGTFPAYDRDSTMASPYIQEVATKETKDMIRQHGLRNSQLLTIAPTGSISNLFKVSGGIEPIYSISYTRTTKSLHNEGDREYKVYSPVVKELKEAKGIKTEDDLPEYVVDAQNIDYKDRIKMQATFQKYIDASISSTVNLPNETTVEEIKDLYLTAWKEGLKGITIFRDGCAREGILKTDDTESNDNKTEMTDQDWIDNGICPNCKTDLIHNQGCIECPNCGFDVCSI